MGGGVGQPGADNRLVRGQRHGRLCGQGLLRPAPRRPGSGAHGRRRHLHGRHPRGV